MTQTLFASWSPRAAVAVGSLLFLALASPALGQVIFEDGFESGDLSAWSSSDCGSGSPCGPTPGSYPLIGWQMFGGAVDDFLARFDLIVGRSNDPNRALAIKALHRGGDMKILYTEDWNVDCGLDPLPDWYLRNSDGSLLDDGGFYHQLMNLSRYAVAAGYHQACAGHMGDDVDFSAFDGVATDGLWGGSNAAWRYRGGGGPQWQNVDINENGVRDRQEMSDASWESDWQQGVDTLLSSMRSRLPAGKVMVINSGAGHWWGWPWTNGIIVEKGRYFDDRFSRSYYSQLKDGTLEPFTTIFDGLAEGDDPALAGIPPAGPDPDRFGTPRHRSRDLLPAMRFGLVTAMFNDLYFSFQDADGLNEHSCCINGNYIGQEHYWSFWYDEFEADLGLPTGDPEELRTGLWYRCFEHGLALANPNGQPQTVTPQELLGLCGYSGPYYRLRSGQDLALAALDPAWPPLHDGSELHQATLQGVRIDEVRRGDGLILFRRPTTVVSDIVIDNSYMSTSPTNDWMQSTGFTQEGCDSGAPPGERYYTVRCKWNPRSFAFAWAPPGSATATFRPTIGIAGDYQVLEWHPDVTNGAPASNARYLINGQDGQVQKVVDQRLGAGRWNSLGVFRFARGTAGSVTISAAGANGIVAADAIKFVFVAEH